ncbi:hypothetical protein AOQ84DRAFT_351281 [Glonium stellatum]|uniref:Amidohydrolase-related domain-containing protein n=1 Tax=Glonium stellatum TaxID=574774 RepID=A0A8E2FDE3_9PEZI|nr:hypothetical protein AOQ84DRAFT_351281 [Glonium stellatum]
MSMLFPLPKIYVKLSGCFSQLPPEFQRIPSYPVAADSDPSNKWAEDVAQLIAPLSNEVFAIMGSKRIVWGSDWPVCNVMGGWRVWRAWVSVTKKLLDKAELTES